MSRLVGAFLSPFCYHGCMEIKAIIFDLDGVVIDSEDVHFEAFGETIADELGIALSGEEYQEFFAGRVDEEGFSNYLRAKKAKNHDPKDLSQKKAQNYLRAFPDRVQPYMAAVNVIGQLVGKLKLALVSSSNKKEIELALDSLGLENVFEVVLSDEDLRGGRGKPAPAPYLLAAKKLKVNPQECLVIEDSPVGVAAAKAAGMKVLAVAHTHGRGELKKADLVVDELSMSALERWGIE